MKLNRSKHGLKTTGSLHMDQYLNISHPICSLKDARKYSLLLSPPAALLQLYFVGVIGLFLEDFKFHAIPLLSTQSFSFYIKHRPAPHLNN